MDSRDWLDRAACRGQDTEQFYPTGTTGAALDRTEQAKAICADCEVRAKCLSYALDTNQDAGIWGGLTEEQRRTLRRSRGRRNRGQQ